MLRRLMWCSLLFVIGMFAGCDTSTPAPSSGTEGSSASPPVVTPTPMETPTVTPTPEPAKPQETEANEAPVSPQN